MTITKRVDQSRDTERFACFLILVGLHHPAVTCLASFLNVIRISHFMRPFFYYPLLVRLLLLLPLPRPVPWPRLRPRSITGTANTAAAAPTIATPASPPPCIPRLHKATRFRVHFLRSPFQSGIIKHIRIMLLKLL